MFIQLTHLQFSVQRLVESGTGKLGSAIIRAAIRSNKPGYGPNGYNVSLVGVHHLRQESPRGLQCSKIKLSSL